jgi:hypothetical protein
MRYLVFGEKGELWSSSTMIIEKCGARGADVEHNPDAGESGSYTRRHREQMELQTLKRGAKARTTL